MRADYGSEWGLALITSTRPPANLPPTWLKVCPPILKQIAFELTLKYLVNDYVKFISVCMKKPLMMLGQSLLHIIFSANLK